MRTAGLLPIAVVGAGFSGTMVAIHLRRHLPAERPVLLCERRGYFARGLAYSTSNPDHLLNVRATNMSAFPDQPDHFVRWLDARGPEHAASIRYTPAGTFAARGLYGLYLSGLLREVIAGPSGASRLILEHDAVTDLAPQEDGYKLTFAGGRSIPVAGAVLASGNLCRTSLGGRYQVDPWHATPLDDLRTDMPLLIIGSGLTMIDAVAAVRHRGYRGEIISVSRRGLLPRAHAPAPPWPTPIFTSAEHSSLRWLTARIRAEIETAAKAGFGWHSVIDSLRPLSVEVWQKLPAAEQRRFLRHLRAYWDVHRHRTAPPAAAMIEKELAAGTLRTLRARIASVADGAGFAVVTLRDFRADQSREIKVQRIIDASGVMKATETDDLLLRRLIARGQIRTDQLGLGFDVTNDLALVDRLGSSAQALWTLGPQIRGAWWECTAVPDIRVQAADLAKTIAGRLNADEGSHLPVAKRA